MPNRVALPPLECCLGGKPNQAASCRPFAKLFPSPIEATSALAVIGPIPGISDSLRLASLSRCHAWIWVSNSLMLIKLGAAKKEAGKTYALVAIRLPRDDTDLKTNGFGFSLRKDKLRQTRRREGRYLLRSNLTGSDPAMLWEYYIQLTEIEQAFKELKSDLAIRPIYHQRDERIEAHIFVAFVAYCLQVTLKHRTRTLAPGLTPRAVLEKFAAVQMVDVHLPITDGRHLILSRYTQPEKDQQLLLDQLKLTLPEQPPPRISSAQMSMT